MAQDDRGALRVRVQLPEPFAMELDAQADQLAALLRDELQRLTADGFGLPIVAEVEVVGAPVDWVRLEIDGRIVVPPLGTLLRVTSGAPASGLRDDVLARSFLLPMPHAERAIAELARSGSAAEREFVTRLLVVDLALATVRRRPSLIVTASMAVRWRSELDPHGRWPQRWSTVELLKAVLEVGSTARLDEHGAAALTAAGSAGSATEEAVQWLVSHSHARPFLRLELAPAVLYELIGGVSEPPGALDYRDERLPGAFRERWDAAASYLLEQTGVLVPAPQLVPAPELEPGMVRVAIGSRALEPVPVPTGGRRWATTLRPSSGSPVYVASNFAGWIVDAKEDATSLSLPDMIPLIVFVECIAATHLLLDPEQVAFRLSQVEDDDPRLVDHVLDGISLAELTLVLRSLVAQRVYLTDLPRVLTTVVEAADLAVGTPGTVALDPRPLVPSSGAGSARWRRTLAAALRTRDADDAARAQGGYARVALPANVQEELEEAWLAGAGDVALDVRAVAESAAESRAEGLVVSDLARPRLAAELTASDPPLPLRTYPARGGSVELG